MGGEFRFWESVVRCSIVSVERGLVSGCDNEGIWRFVVGCVWTTKWRGPDWVRGSGVDGRESCSKYRRWIVGYLRLGSSLR
jgi:hypothetical protein